MSSILDALKKLERERRREEAARHSSPVLEPDEPRVRRRPPLVALAGAGALGAALGLAFALWTGSPRQDEVEAPGQPTQYAPAKPSEVSSLPSRETRHVPPQAELGKAGGGPTAAPAEEVGLGPSAKRRLNLAYERRRKRLQEKAQAPENPGPGASDSPGPGRAAQDRLAALQEAENAVESAPQARPAPPGPSPEADLEAEPARGETSPDSATPVQTGDSAAQEPTQEGAEKVVDTGRSPPGVPKVVLGLLQWSPEPSRRFAFISVDGSPYQKLREGEAARGLAITSIDKDSVTFRYESTRFVIRARH